MGKKVSKDSRKEKAARDQERKTLRKQIKRGGGK